MSTTSSQQALTKLAIFEVNVKTLKAEQREQLVNHIRLDATVMGMKAQLDRIEGHVAPMAGVAAMVAQLEKRLDRIPE